MQSFPFASSGMSFMNLQSSFLSLFLILTLGVASHSSADAAARRMPTRLKSVTSENGQVTTFLDYQPRSGNYTRGVVLMPPTGGVSFLEKAYARALAKRGARVAVVKRWTYDDETSLDLEIHSRLFRRALTAISAISEIFPENIPVTLMGTSLGGLSAAMGASLFDRFDRVMVIAAGGPYASLIAESDHKNLRRLRELRMDHFGFKSIEEYRAAVDAVYDLGPFEAPPNFKNKILGMIILTKDESVPTRFQENLFELWQPEFFRRIDKTHIPGIIETRIRYFNEILNFVFPESVRA